MDDRVAALRPDKAAFDDSTQGERLRRHARACDRGQQRTLASILKIRKETGNPECDALTAVEHVAINEAVDQHLRAMGFKVDNDFQVLQNEPTDDDIQARQNEPTGDDTGQDHRNEPTAGDAASSPQDQSTAGFQGLLNEPGHDDVSRLQNEPTAAAGHDLQNEPTDDHAHDLQNEATVDGRGLQEERGDRAVGEKLAGKRMEWFQMMSHHIGVSEENRINRKERDQKRDMSDSVLMEPPTPGDSPPLNSFEELGAELETQEYLRHGQALSQV